MTDIVDTDTRSKMMSRIRGKDTGPEVAVRKFLFSRGFRFRLHDKKLPGRPDIVLRKYRSVVLVHGCFWHQHPGCKYAYKPKSNKTFWRRKLRSNIRRDKEIQQHLKIMGWRVFVVWECKQSETALNRLAKNIKNRFQKSRSGRSNR